MAQAEAVLVHPRREAEFVQALAVDALARNTTAPLELFVGHDLAELEAEWRRFERTADCTVFQCFDWLAAWQRHVGARTGTTPVIVVGRQPSGEPLFIIPLAVSGGVLRRLTFLGRDVGDYNAPLLAPDFTRVAGHDFRQLWDAITDTLQHDPQGRHDVLVLDKMPETIGAQPNPFLQLDVRPNPSGAYLTALTGDWDSFYAEKRSSSTRRRDRTKRKKLSDIGEVRMTTPEAPAAILATLERLIAQKRKAFQRMGVADMFARPGYVDFLRELASAPPSRRLAHVSSLDVGDTQAATNLGLVFRGGYYHVLASYDDGPLSRFGPGAAHLHELMAYAIGRKCAFFDFTIGDEPYKRDWADREIMLHDCVKPASLRGRAVAAPLDFARRVKRAIKQSPTLWPMVLRLRAALGDTKRRLKGQTTAPAAKADGDD